MKAYSGETLVGDDDEWNRAGPDGRSATYDLSTEAVSPSGDISLDEVTEVRIVGSEPDGSDVD